LQGAAGVAARILGLPGAPAPNTSEDSTVDPSFAVLHGLYWLCANLAADEPLCLIVDDAHWMDGPSRRYLSFLLTRLDELQVALVLATRPCEPGSDAELLAALATDPAADLMQLPPLTGAAIAELVTSDLGSAPDPWNNDYFDDTYWHNGVRQQYQGYTTDVFFNEAKRFIVESHEAKKPFFVYLPLAAAQFRSEAIEEKS